MKTLLFIGVVLLAAIIIALVSKKIFGKSDGGDSSVPPDDRYPLW